MNGDTNHQNGLIEHFGNFGYNIDWRCIDLDHEEALREIDNID